MATKWEGIDNLVKKTMEGWDIAATAPQNTPEKGDKVRSSSKTAGTGTL